MTEPKGKNWRTCEPCGKNFIPRIDRGQFKYCSERCEQVHKMYAPAGTYRICQGCRGIFLALDFDERKCADCHSKPASVNRNGKLCARVSRAG